jgi:DNA-3-methyladenine glycosylase I
MVAEGLLQDEDGRLSCKWHGGLEDYQRYHHQEWGNPVSDDIRLFEKISLEGFQSGLSWLTVLRKRENFRAAFAGFDFEKVALFDEGDIERCLADKGIIRHRGKIVSTINNARRAIELRAEFGSLAKYFWSFEPDESDRPSSFEWDVLRKIGSSAASTKISKDLKKRGWSFVGPTTIYAFMQAMGMVNDHVEGCFCRPLVEKKRLEFKRP